LASEWKIRDLQRGHFVVGPEEQQNVEDRRKKPKVPYLSAMMISWRDLLLD
jgi:hypothetical protein